MNSNDVPGDDQDCEDDINAQLQDLASASFRIRLNFHSIELSGGLSLKLAIGESNLILETRLCLFLTSCRV